MAAISSPKATLGSALSLRQLDAAKPVYSVPRDDLVGEVLIPSMQVSSSLDCMAAFFDSSAFGFLAPGLAQFLENPVARMRLIASPCVTSADYMVMERVLADPIAELEKAVQILFEGARASQRALVQHTYACLAYLLASRRLEFRVAIMRSGHIFHPKVWIFNDEVDSLVVHGSSNFTSPGLLWNYEMVSLERPWRGGDTADKATSFINAFSALWTSGRTDDPIVIDLPEAVKTRMLRDADGADTPTLSDFWSAWSHDSHQGNAPSPPPDSPIPETVGIASARATLQIPAGLVYDSGAFAHQGQAVEAWEGADRRGTLAMATGSGKTVTALIAATRAAHECTPLLVLIAAPFRPLIAQWENEVRRFGVSPLPLADLSSNSERDSRLHKALRSLALGNSLVEVAVTTHDHLVSSGCRKFIQLLDERVASLLIADEVHNLGRESFLAHLPERLRYRLALSATPERQYDPDGTARLYTFFGETVFTFSLAQAIGTCLVPYNYHVHPVPLAEDELVEWETLTERLRIAGFQDDNLDPTEAGKISDQIRLLLIKRRAILELARSKTEGLRTLLASSTGRRLSHTLVYASDKSPQQLEDVNDLLNTLGITFHQLTAEESASFDLTRTLLRRFANGEFQVISCKRVLDEGVDIPEARTAYILASTTVKRQWVQRRGRLLRRSDATGKVVANIHDFVVVPTGAGPSTRSILRQELGRAREFASLSANSGDHNGPFATIEDLST